MRLVNEKLTTDLLRMRKKEFLLCGFQGTNLRNIATSMGVTTGAICRYYMDKTELLDALVEKPAAELLERYREIQRSFSQLPLEQQLSGLPEIPGNGQIWMMRYVYDNFDTFKLIIYCFSGTRCEHYIDELVEVEASANHALVDRMNESGHKLRPIDDKLIRIVSSTLFSGMFKTICHDMPRGKAFTHMDDLKEFYSAGWLKTLGISQL